jgi:Fe-S oxidoreductase
MDLCIGCKGCAKDCPSEVDMAKLKAEITHERHRRHGASVRDRLFANVHRLTAWGSRLAPVSNWLAALPGSDRLGETLFGIARERETPTFASESFEAWFERRDSTGPGDGRRALLVPDPYTNYVEPEIGQAAVRVLAAAGVRVAVPDVTGSGRAAFSKGFLDVARERVEANVATLAPRVAEGWDVVFLEPSDAVMYQSDALDLAAGGPVERVATDSFGFAEYLDRFDLVDALDVTADASLTYHGHCHQTAIGRDHHAVAVLRRAGFDVDALDSGCCGMAGSFGYEAEHYSMSQAIGRILFEQVAESAGDRAVAPGASCRTQLRDRSADVPVDHPATVLDASVSD